MAIYTQKLARNWSKKKVEEAAPLTKVIDTFGIRWVKLEGDEWLGSNFEVLTTKQLFPRKVRQPDWIGARITVE